MLDIVSVDEWFLNSVAYDALILDFEALILVVFVLHCSDRFVAMSMNVRGFTMVAEDMGILGALAI